MPSVSDDGLRQRAELVYSQCKELVIHDDVGYQYADAKASEITALLTGIKDYWHPMKTLAHKNWKMQCEKEGEMLAPVTAGMKLLTAGMANYKARRDQLERERAEAEQDQHRQEAEVQAFELAEDGAPREAIDALMDQASQPVQINPQPELRGKTSFMADYIVTLIDDDMDKIPREFLLPITKAHRKAIEANAKARAKQNGGRAIPGFKILQVQSARTRA